MTLAEELEQLPAEHRREAQRLLELRRRARVLAAELGVDEGDVFHQLQHLQRSPAERLKIGLMHGRLRDAQRA